MTLSIVPLLTVAIKELRELLSRPWQALTLIVGPLAIMIIFGIGSDTSANPPRTIVVIPPGQEQPRLLRDYQRQFDQFLDVTAYSNDVENAREQLRRGVVDAVVVLPPTPFETIASGKQATIQVFYNEIDPLWRWVVPNFTQVMAGELNREIFVQTLSQQQAGLNDAGRDIALVVQALELAIDAADAGDQVQARQQISRAREQSDVLEDALAELGPEAEQLRANVQQIDARLRDAEARLEQEAQATATAGTGVLREELGLDESLRRVRQLESTLERFVDVSPEVVISPIAVNTQNVARLQPDIITFYAPGMLALLAQHIAVSMGALAFVRERLSGSFDLYTAAPITRLQLLLGKYLAYVAFTLVVTLVVVAVLVWGLRVPVLGNPLLLLLTLLLLAIASVGLGLFFSLLATSERQAVQFAMLSLLAVVFFSGFSLPLNLLQPVARTFSYILPATYGTQLLLAVMLRGTSGSTAAMLALGAIGVGLFAACFGMLAWRTRPQ